MEPRRTDYIPLVDDALALPTPELAMRLLAYLAALEDHYGGYGVPFSALQLHADAVASAGTWPEHTDGQHHELFLRAISEAWAWLVANGLLARPARRGRHPGGVRHPHRPRGGRPARRACAAAGRAAARRGTAPAPDPVPHAVLQTMLFSGQRVAYRLDPDGQPQSADPTVAQLALADRERELYVAMTRARQQLTILHDPADARPMTALNPALATLFTAAPTRTLAGGVSERRWRP